MELTESKRRRTHVFGVWKKSDFRSFRGFFHSPAMGWFLFLIGCFSVTLLLSFQIEKLPTTVKVGSIAPKDIKADQNYEIINEKATQKDREDALLSVLPVYDYDEAMADEVDKRLQEGFEQNRILLAQNPVADWEELRDNFEKITNIRLSDEEAKLLANQQYRYEMESLVRGWVRTQMMGMIGEEVSVIQKFAEQGILIRRVRLPQGENEMVERNLGRIRSVAEVKEDLLEQAKLYHPPDIFKKLNISLVAQIAGRFVRPNLNYNVAETEWRKSKTVAAVKPTIKKIQAGESIIRSGDRFTGEHLMILQGIYRQKRQTNFVLKFVGTFLFVVLLILVTYSFASRYIRKFKPTATDLLFLGTNLVAILIFVRLFAASASAFRESLPFEIDMQTIYYAIPVSAGAMLIRLILNSEVALIFGVIASALAGLFLRTDLDFSIYFLISSIAAAGSIAYADRRMAILKAGVVTGLINVLTIFTIKMVQVVSVTQSWEPQEIVISLVTGFLGGINSSLYVFFFAPLVEMLFGYTTDVKLLELGNLNHPLLKQMIVQAPGTYHHSQVVAVLAEAAAESIGANPILARVGAYFHDVGKMRKPLYFIENQMGGENRHDKLAPSMSALIISSHVKDGVEMAEEYKLPKVIVDMIPQHQGTKLISYFYNKAKENEEADLHTVKEEDYRYPGPRPQTREAGILLLADGVEAAVRSLPEKTPAKIQAMLQKIINKSFVEEQLEECDLTLKDLKQIADSFLRVLVGIYHQRIEYPETPEKKAVPMPIRLEVVSPAAADSKKESEKNQGKNDSKQPTADSKTAAPEASGRALNCPQRTGHS